jgi:protein-S-isoprenylcysteine O-methyltransferase Ste14
MDSQTTSGVRFPPPLYFLLPLLLSIATQFLFPAQRLLSPLMAAVVGASLIALGIAFAASALVTMWRSRTSPNPTVPTRALVTGGPYRFTRNPLYVALTLVYLGVTVWTQAIWAFAYLPLVLFTVRRQVIDKEERYLAAKFGETYDRYRERVRRWI